MSPGARECSVASVSATSRSSVGIESAAAIEAALPMSFGTGIRGMIPVEEADGMDQDVMFAGGMDGGPGADALRLSSSCCRSSRISFSRSTERLRALVSLTFEVGHRGHLPSFPRPSEAVFDLALEGQSTTSATRGKVCGMLTRS